MSVLDFSDYITDRTRDFIGREWVFDKIDAWLIDPNAPRFFIITGEPGIGKTAIAAQLTQIRDLNAHHFCIARRADTIDPLEFARSTSQQLTRIDGFAQGILQDSGVHVNAQQKIHEVHGQAINVQIEHLSVSAPSATIAFNRVVLDPLRRLYAGDFDRPLLLLVDALDEAVQQRDLETIVDLLANARGLPPQVRFVLTTRPEGAALRHFEQLNIPHLVLDAGRAENQADVQAYVRYRLDHSETLRWRLAEETVEADTFIERVTEASQGNFLYLVWLLRSVEEGIQRFDSLEALPKGLDGIYREFLRTRTVGQDIERWRDSYRPLLGMLAAAQEPLTVEQLASFTGLDRQQAKDTLLDVEQFLDPVGADQGQYRLYHQSVADFLSNEEQAREFWIDIVRMHQRVADYYLQTYGDDWTVCDDVYGLQNLATHLYILKDFELYKLVENRTWTAAKYVDTPRAGSLIRDLRLVSTIAAGGDVEDWARAMGYHLRRALVDEMMSHVSDRVIFFLTRQGQIDRVLDLARRKWDKFKLLREIASIVAPAQPAKAVEILTELAHLADDESALEQCKAQLVVAQEILHLVPASSCMALNFLKEARSLEREIPNSDLIQYRVAWYLPTLALSGDLDAALAESENLLPLERARALRHISSLLPENHPSKKSLAEQAFSILETLEQTPEVTSERMRAIVVLFPSADESRRQDLLEMLRSDGDYLESLEASQKYSGLQNWVIERMAEVDLGWAKQMLVDSGWHGTLEAYAVVREIARVDVEEALRIFEERFSNHVLGSKLLVDTIGIIALRDIDRAEALIRRYSKGCRYS
jgi:hypothetical protein